MSPTEELRKLLARVEAATGLDETLDEDCARAVSRVQRFAQLADAPPGTGCMMYDYGQEGRQQSALRVTASLDAAFGFMSRVLPDFDLSHGEVYWTHGLRAERVWVCRLRWYRAKGVANEPNFAVLAATLNALISMERPA